MTVLDLLLLLLKGFLAFVSTNVDDLLLLTVLLRTNVSKTDRKRVMFSQYLSFLIIIVISILGSFSKFFLPLNKIGLLGLVLILYGIRKLFLKKTFYKSSSFTIVTMTLFGLADGLDNISAYIVLFASESLMHVYILIGFFFFLLTVWYYIGSTLASTRSMTRFKKKLDQAIPFIYVSLGILIMYENKTLDLLYELAMQFLPKRLF